MTNQPPNNFFNRGTDKQVVSKANDPETNRQAYFNNPNQTPKNIDNNKIQENLNNYAPPAASPYPQNNYQNVETIKKPAVALVAFWLGIASLLFIPFTAIAAIITGHQGLQRTDKGAGNGYVYAKLGTIFGYFSAVIGLLAIIAAFALPVYVNEQRLAIEKEVNNDVRMTVSQIKTGVIVPTKPIEVITTKNDTDVYVIVNVEQAQVTVTGVQNFGGAVYYSYVYDSLTDSYFLGDIDAKDIKDITALIAAQPK